MPVSVDPRIGEVFMGYRLEARLGRGGMGIVYRAEHLRLKRKVALKLLAPELAEDEPFRERFLRESELAASLDHPHIVPIYDAGEFDGQLFVAMRYVAGGDLRTLLREQGRLEPERTLALVAQVADALDAAHEAGLVHRDVKPGNVLLDSRDHCYLSDFGVTKQISSQSGLTATGAIVGTTDYVAPEVIEGKPVDARADIYSLGCLLYECLAGEAPFHRDSDFAVLWAHVNQAPPKLSDLRPELPRALDAVVGKALAKEPQRRYDTARALVEAGRRSFPPAAPIAPSKRRRRALLAAAVLALAGVAVAVLLSLTTRRGHGPSTKPTPAVTTDAIQRIDPRTNKLVATIRAPVGGGLLARGGGAVWAANGDENQLFWIDAERNTVAPPIHTLDPRALAFGAGSLWVLDAADGVVTRFDPTTGSATATLSLPPGATNATGAIVRASDEAVWVQWASARGNAVRIDPASTAVKPVRFGPKSVSLVEDFGPAGPVLWVLVPNPREISAGLLLRVDARKPSSSAPAIIPVEVPFGFIVPDRGGVWLNDVYDDQVIHVDARTKRVDRRVAVGDAPIGIVEGEGAVWVASNNAGTVTRIDPATGKVVAVIPVGPNPTFVVVESGSVWTDVHPRSG